MTRTRRSHDLRPLAVVPIGSHVTFAVRRQASANIAADSQSFTLGAGDLLHQIFEFLRVDALTDALLYCGILSIDDAAQRRVSTI